MKRKTSERPTRIYSYRCKPPIKNDKLFDDQVFAGHLYRNQLVELERTRRERVDEAMREFGEVGNLAARLEALESELAAIRGTIKQRRRQFGKHVDIDAESEQAKAIIDQLRETRAALKEAKARIRESKALKRRFAAIEEWYRSELKSRREATAAFWGTYLIAEAAILNLARKSTRAPKFRRYDGSGRIAVQLQGGLTVAEAFSGEDTRLKIKPLAEGVAELPRYRRKKASWSRVQLRIGSDEKRRPIFTELPVMLHRPLPEDAIIKWAWVSRRRVGGHFDYYLQLTVEAESFECPQAMSRDIVAVDLGWRRKDDGSLRAAYWVSSSGQQGEVLVSPELQGRLRFIEDLTAIRDKRFDAIRDELTAWLKKRRKLPAWLVERTKDLQKWRSAARLAALLRDWYASDERVARDIVMLEKLTAWAKQDRHLHNWAAHQRARAIRQRREQYRLFAVALACRSATIVLEDFDLRQARRRLRPEDGLSSDEQEFRQQANLAAPGSLRKAIIDAATKHGVEVSLQDRAFTTQVCHVCGVCDRWDARRFLQHTCASCGATWDQDYNACKNLLARHQTAKSPRDSRVDGP